MNALIRGRDTVLGTRTRQTRRHAGKTVIVGASTQPADSASAQYRRCCWRNRSVPQALRRHARRRELARRADRARVTRCIPPTGAGSRFRACGNFRPLDVWSGEQVERGQLDAPIANDRWRGETTADDDACRPRRLPTVHLSGVGLGGQVPHPDRLVSIAGDHCGLLVHLRCCAAQTPPA